jgi:large subunit ribosomal protein L20
LLIENLSCLDSQSPIDNHEINNSLLACEEVRDRRTAHRPYLQPPLNRKQKENTMPRVKRGTKRRAKRKKILDRASGYFLTKSKLYRSAKEAVERGLKFAYSGRKQRKRQYRSLWIVRIGAAAKLNGMSYNQFIHGLKVAGVELDRKILADLAVKDPAGFANLATQAKAAIAG